MQRKTILQVTQILTAFTCMAASALAQQPGVCSWPLETTGKGITNVAYPDTNSTYWTMPVDPTAWKEIIITGTYPRARYFSFAAYNAEESLASDDSSSLVDVKVDPDEGSANSFRNTPAEGQLQQYTIHASSTVPANPPMNFVQLGNTHLGWLIYRVYVPDHDMKRAGGVPLPSLTFVDHNNQSHPIAPCSRRSSALAGLNLPGLIAPLVTSSASCGKGQPASWIPANTGNYFPNPHNKYMAIPNLCLEKDQIVVVRGKAPVFPDTYNGGPIWEPEGVNMRYWSMCNNKQAFPFPVEYCEADYATKLDAEGYYTYVVSEPEGRTGAAPSWLPDDATWLRWSSPKDVDILLFRNMLPADGFEQSVQAAQKAGCVANNQIGKAPDQKEIDRAAGCAQRVMQEYYPKAVYCSKQVFLNEGWKGCFAAAEAGAN